MAEQQPPEQPPTAGNGGALTPPAPPPNDGSRTPIALEDEMKSAFIDYAMSVIVSRALPDVRDGLKPVHRRILYAQQQLSNFWNRPYVKCARVVGEVLGKYHPHGDASVYDALVRMAQDFAMRYQLVDGQGNFGSVDGDPAAAYRYTECRMTRMASDMMGDIEKETVDWQPNFDDKELEPTVLPTRVPNLMINGSTGIAVGMATNIPPHNLTEVVNGCIEVAKNPAITSRELMRFVTGPDFPTGAFIYGREGIRQAYETGRGAVVMRGRAEIEVHKKTGREAIIVTEIPYMMNKSRWIQNCAELVKDKKLEGISDIRDESDRTGMRVVFEIKRDAMGTVVLNNLYKQTQLQSSFGVMMLAIVEGRPKLLTLRDALGHFVDFRREVVTRRTIFELKEAKARLEIVEGLGLAIDVIDRIIAIIRGSDDPDTARGRLCAEPLGGLQNFLRRAGRPEAEIAERIKSGDYYLSERQAQAILDMRLQRLTGLERDKLEGEYKELCATIDRLELILGDEAELLRVVVGELEAVREQFGDGRRTEIVDDEGEISIIDMIANEDMVVTLSHAGYVKRNPVSEYRAQKRGGRGVMGASTKEEDFVTSLFVASTHEYLLMFTSTGRAFMKRVYELPEGSKGSRGKALVNLLELRDGERVVAVLPLKSLEDEPGQTRFLIFATRKGQVKKTELAAYANIRSSGIIALGVDDDDQLLQVHISNGKQHLLMASQNGFCVRFSEELVRPMGRAARGVRGMGLRGKDVLVGMAVIDSDAGVSSDAGPVEGSETATTSPTLMPTLMTVCERGYGKRTPLTDYPQKGRGGKGVITIKTTERNGKVVGVRIVTDDDDLMMITTSGKVIRMPVDGIPTLGRNTQGVRLIKLTGEEKVVALESLAERDEEAGERVKADVEVLEGQEDLSDDQADEQGGDADDGGVPDEVDEGPTTKNEVDDEE